MEIITSGLLEEIQRYNLNHGDKISVILNLFCSHSIGLSSPQFAEQTCSHGMQKERHFTLLYPGLKLQPFGIGYSACIHNMDRIQNLQCYLKDERFTSEKTNPLMSLEQLRIESKHLLKDKFPVEYNEIKGIPNFSCLAAVCIIRESYGKIPDYTSLKQTYYIAKNKGIPILYYDEIKGELTSSYNIV